jgi:hypothetical protein
MGDTFRILDWKRARRALGLGALFLVFLLIVGFTSKPGRTVADPFLDVGAAPFLWYFGGIIETGPFGLLAFVFDIVVYAAVLYVALTLKQYAAGRRRRPSQ